MFARLTLLAFCSDLCIVTTALCLNGLNCGDVTKGCSDAPVSHTDIEGIQVCLRGGNAVTCLTITTIPFYACICKCGYCGKTCEHRCGHDVQTSSNSTGATSLAFVIGGIPLDFNRSAPPEATDAVHVYNFSSGTWSKEEKLPQKLAQLAAVGLNGTIYVIGGSDMQWPVSNVFTHDASKGKWSSAANMTMQRLGHAAAALNGKIYVMGGLLRNQASVEVYDPNTNAWSLVASMSIPRSGATAVACEGKVYVIGGYGRHPQDILSTGERYSVERDEWTPIASMAQKRLFPTAAVVDGKLYVMGGFIEAGFQAENATATMEVYDPTVDSWSRAPSMSVKRSGAQAVVHEGLIYVLGGHDGASVLSSVEIFNPQRGVWTISSSPMPRAAALAGAALLTV